VKTAVMFINFGEPAEPTLDNVVPYLEGIFLQNVGLERSPEAETRRVRVRKMARARAPGLIEEYEAIGGSPLNAQADAQADALEAELRARGRDITCYSCFQFTEPSVYAAVERARADGVERLVGLPVYPLCGHSTNVAALQSLRAAVEAEGGWSPELLEIGGWHRHPDFCALHADNARAFAEAEGVDLHDPDTAFLFSIHGTPIKYLEEGSRYDRYVEEACAAVAAGLGLARYHMGYQNHSNRPVDWTQPDVERVVKGLEARRVVVLPIAFMHEQSETLAELDHELREEAEEAGLAFHRVPVPWDSPRFVELLADLVEGRLGEEPAGTGVPWRRCLCRSGGHAWCTNGMRFGAAVVPANESTTRG